MYLWNIFSLPLNVTVSWYKTATYTDWEFSNYYQTFRNQPTFKVTQNIDPTKTEVEVIRDEYKIKSVSQLEVGDYLFGSRMLNPFGFHYDYKYITKINGDGTFGVEIWNAKAINSSSPVRSITATKKNEYPNNEVLDGYWYEYVGIE